MSPAGLAVGAAAWEERSQVPAGPWPSRGRLQERGSGTVLALAVVAVLLSLGLLAVGLVQAQSATAHAQAGADLAALAGATALSSVLAPADPCVVAGQVATANQVELTGCSITGEDVTVRTEAQARVLGVPRVAVGSARAGPADTP